jgi:hypothetical protein
LAEVTLSKVVDSSQGPKRAVSSPAVTVSWARDSVTPNNQEIRR